MIDIEFNEEEFMDETFNENEAEDEVNEIDLELIRIVKRNPALWDKSSKAYSNSTEKHMMWDSVASVLPVEMTGAAAAKRFRTLRTMFSRHLKRVKQSQPRSGAGSDWSIYEPIWPLYNEMLFLADVIKPRQTKSNIFTKPMNILRPKADGHSNSTATVLEHSYYQPQKSQSSCNKNYVYDKSEKLKTPINTKPIQLQSKIILNDSNDINNFKDNSIASESDNESNAKSSVSTCRCPKKRPIPRTPSPDKFYKIKQIKTDTTMDNIDKLAGSLATLSEQIFSTSSTQHSRQEEKENFDPQVEGFLLLMKASLQRVRTQHIIPCLIEMLNILHSFQNKC